MTRKQTMTPKKFKACMDSLLAASVARKAKASFGVWKCVECGAEAPATVHQMRKKYCSKSCMGAAYKSRLRGESNPNFSNAGMHKCVSCGGPFKTYFSTRKYCSRKCYASGGHRGRAKLDSNHFEVIAAFKAFGAGVIDASTMGAGFPDLLVNINGSAQLVEVKNPNTEYGRKGLTAAQQRFADEWRGSPVHIVRTVEDVQHFIAQIDYDLQEWR